MGGGALTAGRADEVAARGGPEQPRRLDLDEAERAGGRRGGGCSVDARRERVLARRRRDRRLGDLADPVDQVDPLAGLEDRRHLGGELLVGAERRRVGDLDPVGVIGQGERRGLALEAGGADDLIGLQSRPAG